MKTICFVLRMLLKIFGAEELLLVFRIDGNIFVMNFVARYYIKIPAHNYS